MKEKRKFDLHKVAGALASVAIGFLFLGGEVNAQEATTSAPNVEVVEVTEAATPVTEGLIEAPTEATDAKPVDIQLTEENQPIVTEDTSAAEAALAEEPESVIMMSETSTDPISVTKVTLGGSFVGDKAKTEDFYYYDVEFNVLPGVSGGETKTFTLSEGFKISGPETSTLDLIHESGTKFADVTFTPANRTAVLKLDKAANTLDNVKGGFRISFTKNKPTESEIGDQFKISLSVNGQAIPSSEKSLEYVGYGREIKFSDLKKIMYQGNADPGVFWNIIYVNQGGDYPVDNIVLIDDIDPQSEDNVSYIKESLVVQIVNWTKDPKVGPKMSVVKTITPDVMVNWSEHGKFTMNLPAEANSKQIVVTYKTRYDNPVDQGEKVINKITLTADGIEKTRTASASVSKLSGFIVGDTTKGSVFLDFLSEDGKIIKNRMVLVDKNTAGEPYRAHERAPRQIESDGLKYEFVRFAEDLNDPAVEAANFNRVDSPEGLVEGRTTKQVVAIYRQLKSRAVMHIITEDGRKLISAPAAEGEAGEDYKVSNPFDHTTPYNNGGELLYFQRIAIDLNDPAIAKLPDQDRLAIPRVDNLSGVLEKEDKHIVFVLGGTPVQGTVTVHFLSEDGEEIAPPSVDRGMPGTGYQVEKPEKIYFQGKEYILERVANEINDAAIENSGNQLDRVDPVEGIYEGFIHKQIVLVYKKFTKMVPGEAPTVELPIAEIGVTPGEAPTVELPIAEIGMTPGEAPTVELPIAEIGMTPGEAPTVELPIAEIGMTPGEAPTVELPIAEAEAAPGAKKAEEKETEQGEGVALLPQTGETPGLLISLAGVIAAGAGALVLSKKKKKR